MSIHIKIAKWLAPEVFRENEWLILDLELAQESRDSWKYTALQRGIALRNISNLRTPKCAHIGKRMADIADAALKTEGSK